ncbi:MAG: tetratricopeptide repeat protein [Oscillospiraceae bacterium]|jgi:tetratricopeptide (TPR) repeat protein|nr:tetratricopeptide repeat protein [Oscillospiraceae bacterium]
MFSKENVAEWQQKLDIIKIDKNNPDYSDMYALRYFLDESNGVAFLEEKMSKSEPNIGYYHLSHRMKKQHSIVITTNFDHLVEQTVSIYQGTLCRVVSTPELAKYINPASDKPQILKVHGDLLLSPKSRKHDIAALNRAWKSVLDLIFSTYNVIVVGYDGGDPGFMKALCAASYQKLYWCVMEGSTPSDEVIRLLNKNGGTFVTIDNFDGLMIQLGQSFEDPRPDYLKEEAENRIRNYNKIIDSYNKTLPQSGDTRVAFNARNYIDLGNSDLQKNKYDQAIVNYSKAIELDPLYAVAYNNRGLAYHSIGYTELAIKDLSEAIKLSPDNHNYYKARSRAYTALNKPGLAAADMAKYRELIAKKS